MQVKEYKSVSDLQDAIGNEFKKISESFVISQPKKLYGALKYAIDLGGKRTRPIAVLLGCDLFGGDVQKALPAAVAVELFHNFTLIHDDIMDAAPLRRGAATVHKKWNLNIAILGGDALFVKAYEQLNSLELKNKTDIFSVFNQVALKVCEGQQFDMDYESLPYISINEYLNMIELKTAVLLAGSFQIGALVAGAHASDALNVYEFGKHIGIAFQLKDDILDVYGDTKKFGKQKGGDIISNKKTILLLKAIELAKKDEKIFSNLNKWLSEKGLNAEEKITEVIKIYDALEVKQFAEGESEKHFNEAILCLEKINAGADKKQQLKIFAQSLMNRQT